MAFADDFFYGAEKWGDLTLVDNHRWAIDALTATLLDSELVGLDEE